MLRRPGVPCPPTGLVTGLLGRSDGGGIATVTGGTLGVLTTGVVTDATRGVVTVTDGTFTDGTGGTGPATLTVRAGLPGVVGSEAGRPDGAAALATPTR